jgi:SAM-dependent methyltransferase
MHGDTLESTQVAEQPLEDLQARLERERLGVDRQYNDALTALDRAIQAPGQLPAGPRGFDDARVSEINQGWDILPGGPPTIDRSLKGRLRGFIWRLIGPPLQAQRQFNASIVDHINRNVDAGRELPETLTAALEIVRQEFEALVRFESLLVQYVQTITAYVDTKDRSLGGSELGQRLELLERRLLALKRGGDATAGSRASPPDAVHSRAAFGGEADSGVYVAFEDRFRGPENTIRVRVQDYLPMLEAAANVVEIGCGRGELLAALKERGVRGRGVDANAGMVELCTAQGLDVEHGDALSYLDRARDGSVGALVAIQVVEHFDPGYLTRFLDTAHHKMAPGALLILETINPTCWMAFFETYLRDLTHQRPLHPDTLRYLVQASGFTHADVQFREPVRDVDRLPRVTISGDSAHALPRNLAQVADTVNAHADRLNARLFSSMDYVVIARR